MTASTIKKVWHFIWDSDNIWSWILNVILAFVIIKFLVYPGLGLILGTEAPIVAVVSGSMEHDMQFNEWWTEPSCCDDQCSKQLVQGEYYEKKGITEKEFHEYPFRFGFDKGDIMLLHKINDVKQGDVIVYRIKSKTDPIIHRVINIKEENGKKYYFTKGDHNCGTANFENAIQEEQVMGKATLRAPFLGWIKIIFVKTIQLFM